MVKLYREFKKKEDGASSLEFVLLFPIFIFLFLMGFESGYYMVRNVMLERAVDVAVREVRLGNGQIPEFQLMKARICYEAGIIPDCMNSLQLEMREIDPTPGSTAVVRQGAKCVNKSETPQFNKDDTKYDVGSANNLMMLRVCSMTNPFFPTTGLGVGMQRAADGDRTGVDGDYAIISTTLFVNEPGNRAMRQTPEWFKNSPMYMGDDESDASASDEATVESDSNT